MKKKLTQTDESDYDTSITKLYLEVKGELIRVITADTFIELTGIRQDTLKKRRLQKTYKVDKDYFEHPKDSKTYYFDFQLVYEG